MGGKVLDYEAKKILNLGKAEGMAEGKAEGMAEGRAEGRTEGQALVFLNLLTHGFSQKDAQALSDLSDAQVSVILKESK